MPGGPRLLHYLASWREERAGRLGHPLRTHTATGRGTEDEDHEAGGDEPVMEAGVRRHRTRRAIFRARFQRDAHPTEGAARAQQTRTPRSRGRSLMDMPWTRRTFLLGAGVGTLAAAGLSWVRPGMALAQAPGARTRFVATWNAADILDPHVKYDGSTTAFSLNLYDNLLRYQGNPPEIVPWLAETYETTDEGRTWVFHLRRGVTFHDGSALTADAVHFSFARLLALGKAPAGAFQRMGLTVEQIRVAGSLHYRDQPGAAVWPFPGGYSAGLDRQPCCDQGPRAAR